MDEGVKLGWERKDIINWSAAKPVVHDQFSITMGFIVGGTFEVDTNNLTTSMSNDYEYISYGLPTEISRDIHRWFYP